MDDLLQRLEQKLRTHNQSVTETRRTVFMALVDQEPMTMHALVERTADSVNRASVYRTVALFEKLGIIERLQMGWKYKIELSDEFSDHHHHLSCTRCGQVVAVDEHSNIERAIETIVRSAGFTHSSHQLEIRGVCPHCQTAPH